MSEEGGDESPAWLKRKIKQVVVLSATSDSDSDESVGVAGTRRKRLRVISDEEASDSSGSSVVCAGSRRRRILPKLRDSDAESDSSDWTTDRSPPGKDNVATNKTNSGFASDSSEGNSDKCSICLMRFTNQEIGTPEICEHIFCLDCITEWSKNVNTCPVDRLTFNSIIVRTCIGGRVLRTEAVRTVQRSSSVEALVVEDPTICEICRSMESEETMLLCDGCDLGFHMHCLNPPLSEVPADQWLCPNCFVDIDNDQELMDAINLSEVEDLFDGIIEFDLPVGPRPTPLRQPRNVRRSARNVRSVEEPSTSSSNHTNNGNEQPTTSQGTRSTLRTTSRSINRRRTTTRRRKYKRRRTKTVIIEYEVQENGKFPITRKIKRRVKKRRVKKRQPRTAARRSYVRASVQAKLASQRSQRQEVSAVTRTGRGVKDLTVNRHRASIPSLSLLGNPNELEYFSDEDNTVSEDASTAVAVRPSSNIFSAYRQARRKIVSVPSPPHASSAPDLLSNILESQTLLHSKNSLVSITVDGNINIKLQTQKQSQQKKTVTETKEDEKVDLSKAKEAVKCAPSYPGQGRGGGGWGGGYRGGYGRDQHHANGGFNRGGYDSGYGAGYQGRPAGYGGYQNSGMRRDDPDYYDPFPRRPQQFTNADDCYYDRSRRLGMDNGRGGFVNHHRNDGGRYSGAPGWPSAGAPAGPSAAGPPPHARHSFGGFENPVDMRMTDRQMPQSNPTVDMFSGIVPHQDKPQPPPYRPQTDPSAFRPSPEPHPYQSPSQQQSFVYPKASEVEKSEDERSDPGLIIDTEKYDPTEPTHDEDSGEEDKTAPAPPAPPSPQHNSYEPESTADESVQNILAGIDAGTMNVPPSVLDSAVRQVLKEHRNLISSPGMKTNRDGSEDESDGDCPNFSIYSAASVHIANYVNDLPDEPPAEPRPTEGLEDLVQEDDDTPPDTSPVETKEAEDKKIEVSRPHASKPLYGITESNEKRKSEEEYKEKVSKRCPITTNTRNPIKIKLNTPSLIKRQVSLYDEEDTSMDAGLEEKLDVNPKINENKLNAKHDSPKKEHLDTAAARNKEAALNEDDSQSSGRVQELKQSSKRKSFEETISTPSKEIKENDGSRNTNKERKQSPSKSSKESNDNNIDEVTKNCEDTSGSDIKRDYRVEHLADIDPDKDTRISNENDHKVDDNVEKMTESISETEDERSYTPCLDENKSNKDASFDNERDKGLEGLDTEMISEDEGNEMFSENERAPSNGSRASPVRLRVEEGQVHEKKEVIKKITARDENVKKKKKKDSKKENKEKDKGKNKKKTEITFKKLSKSGKERNYRERDRDKGEKKSGRDRRDSGDNDVRQRRRKEKRKDLQRYDVRSLVTEKRRKLKDPFGRDVSPRERSPSLSPPERSPSPPGRRDPSPRRTPTRLRRDPSPIPASRSRRSPSRIRRSHSRIRRSSSKTRRSHSRPRRSFSRGRKSPSRPRASPLRLKRSVSRGRRSPSAARQATSRSRRSPNLRKSPSRRNSVRGRTASRGRTSPGRGRRSVARRSPSPRVGSRRSPARSPMRRKRRRSSSRPARRRSATGSPPRRTLKKKKRERSTRRVPAAASPERKRRRSESARPAPAPPSPASRPPSPRTPSPEPAPSPLALEEVPERLERRRRDPERHRRRLRDAPGPSKEVFTSGDNILVSVSFKEQERGEESERRRRRETRRERRRRRRAAVPLEVEVAKPVAIIDLDRSPFRELTPSPKNVIVLSDSDHGEREVGEEKAPVAEVPAEAPTLGPKTPPEPLAPEPAAAAPPEREHTPPEEEPHSPDAYDPFEPTRSASASPPAAAAVAPPSPPRALITLEAAQRSNLSADEVIDRRPLSPVEKVMALLQSTRDESPEPPPGVPEQPPAPRIVLPSPTRVPPKLFPGKPSPIKSNPVKPMQVSRLPRPPPPALLPDAGSSPYSPGSSDFGELFEPPARRPRAAPRHERKRGKTQVDVRIDDDNLMILDELPSSAVAMQVKSKYLKKLNRQERVVEEVKLVLKPHYNKKRVTKEEYKDILRRAVPKICHNKSGEINPTKIQALVEAYVKKFRKKHKMGIV
ncbi:hypothetical protein KGM_209988 [Danaus plexippus plexippus]|uniref:Uncharacterized protein n=1 Tax=Danaus plexippus plexippus TaxID=278856 RepID=A0A212FHT8_DANPL|nr:hypothetical protein KGM_209988 [Danaus plexippus plexippus]